MSFDSTASLLFAINANSDDAEANIQRFRTLLSKDLSDLSGEFSDWSGKVFGSLSTVSGAMTAGTAALAAGVVALGGFLLESAEKYQAYAEQINSGVKMTGLSAETMSELAFAAKMTGTNFDTLTRGVTFFERAVYTANQTDEARIALSKTLGVTQQQVAAGEKNILPLLVSAVQHYQDLGSATERTAYARQLFSRSGVEMQGLLKLGAEGLREMAAEAAKLGLVLSGDDLEAMHQHAMATTELKSAMSAFGIAIGREVLPYLTKFVAIILGIPDALRATYKEVANFSGILKSGLTLGLSDYLVLVDKMAVSGDAAAARIERMAKLLEAAGNAAQHAGKAHAEAEKNWRGFSDVLEAIKGKIAETGTEEDKVIETVHKLQVALRQAGDQYKQLVESGKNLTAIHQREMDAFAQSAALLPELVGKLAAAAQKKEADAVRAAGEEIQTLMLQQGEQTIATKTALWDLQMTKQREHLLSEQGDQSTNLAALDKLWVAGWTKIGNDEAIAQAKTLRDLDSRIEAQGEQTMAVKVAAWNREVDGLRTSLATEGKLKDGAEERLIALEQAGLDRIKRDKDTAYASETAKLGEHLESVEKEWQTSEQRIQGQYQADVAKYSEAEMQKSLLTASSEAQRTAIIQLYVGIRAGLLKKEDQDLQALKNSQGWQGVFGSQFASMIKGNEALTKEWASSTNQSLLMVKVALETMKEQGQQAFSAFAQGMGSGIADAIVYKKSVGDAMRAALASTLESLSAQSIAYAIYSTGLGFLRLAEHDAAGAASAFTAAVEFGALGAVTAVLGRAVAPPSTTAAGSSASAAAGSSSAAGSDSGSSTGSPAPTVNVYVQGHVVGWTNIDELTAALNDAVLNKDVPLTATNTKTGVQVTR